MPFKDTNKVYGLPPNSPYQVGRSDVDTNGSQLEKGILLPFPSDPQATWLYYDCTVECMLDSGIVVHNRLPQVDNLPDSLASCFLDDPSLEKLKGGVNLTSNDRYTDIQQRMAHARYWFHIYGQALRVGIQIPIPGIKTIGGVPAIPYDDNPQRAFNRIFPGGNYSGIILWHAGWSLWYTTTQPPRSNVFPAADAAAHINGTVQPPANGGIQAPFSQPDDSSTQQAPSPNRTPPQGGVTQ